MALELMGVIFIECSVAGVGGIRQRLTYPLLLTNNGWMVWGKYRKVGPG